MFQLYMAYKAGACILSLQVARARARAKPFTFSLAPNPNARVAIYHAHQFETVPEITPLHLLSASIHSIHTRLRDRRSAHNVLRSGRKTEGPHRRFPVYPYLILLFNTVSQYLFSRPPDTWFPVFALSHRSGLRRTRSSDDGREPAERRKLFRSRLDRMRTGPREVCRYSRSTGSRPSALWRSPKCTVALVRRGGDQLGRLRISQAGDRRLLTSGSRNTRVLCVWQ